MESNSKVRATLVENLLSPWTLTTCAKIDKPAIPAHPAEMSLRLWFVFLVWLLPWKDSCLAASPPSSPPQCVVCGKSPLVGRYYVHEKHGAICTECAALPHRCSLCSLPVLENALTSKDGRKFCPFDAPQVILNEVEARRIFVSTQRALEQLTRGGLRLREPRVTVDLFDIDYWNQGRGAAGPASGMHRMGISSSRVAGKDWHHTVILLSGQRREQLVAVCAHEITHLWINENRPQDRVIEPNTVEAICEWVAWRLAGQHAQTEVQEHILKNPYTEGRIQEVIAWESRFGAINLLRWVREGSQPTLGPQTTTPPRPSMAIPSPSAPATPASKSTVACKAILGTPSRRVAMINGTPMQAGTSTLITLGPPSMQLRVDCLEVREESVKLRIPSLSLEWDLGVGAERDLASELQSASLRP